MRQSKNSLSAPTSCLTSINSICFNRCPPHSFLLTSIILVACCTFAFISAAQPREQLTKRQYTYIQRTGSRYNVRTGHEIQKKKGGKFTLTCQTLVTSNGFFLFPTSPYQHKNRDNATASRFLRTYQNTGTITARTRCAMIVQNRTSRPRQSPRIFLRAPDEKCTPEIRFATSAPSRSKRAQTKK